MELSIIIVSWNTRDLLKRCLDSIYIYTRGVSFEIFVIDNASSDGTAKMMESYIPPHMHEENNLRFITNTRNRGFAAANNQGIRQSTGKYILLLNPDTALQDDALTLMVAYMKRNSHCGIAGCRLLNPDKLHQDSIRRFPGFWDQTLILLKLHHLFNPSFLKRYLAADADYSKIQTVDQVMGACFMIRRDLITKIGLLDEGFFNWFEEVDYCKRAYTGGYKACYLPDAAIIHHFGQSFKQVIPLKKQLMWNKSLRYYFKKHHTFSAYIGIILVSWLSALIAYWYTVYTKRNGAITNNQETSSKQ